MKSYFWIIAIFLHSANSLASAMLPLEVRHSGSFNSSRGNYDLSVRLDEKTRLPVDFKLVVDGIKIPIPTKAFSDFQALDLSSIEFTFARDEWIQMGDEIVVPPYAVLHIFMRAYSEKCESETSRIHMTVNTLKSEKWTFDTYCQDGLDES